MPVAFRAILARMQYVNVKQYVQAVLSQTPPVLSYQRAGKRTPLAEWQIRVRERIRQVSGLDDIQAAQRGDPIECRDASREVRDGYSLEKHYLRAEPGMEIPFYLLLPESASSTSPVPLVLTPHGHGRRGKEVYVGNYENDEEREHSESGDRDIALQAVEAGYAVIAPDVRGFWEMARQEEMAAGKGSSCDELQRRSLMLGRSLIGERVFDMGRLMDYAATRPEIDSTRIAITGNSGGGTVSLFTAALDERISVAVPGSYFCSFEASILSVHHCMCNIVPGIARLVEMSDIAGLIAPRPVLFVNGIEDRIFPFAATQNAFSELQRVYRDAGVPDRCRLYAGDGGHRYYKDEVWSFLAEFL